MARCGCNTAQSTTCEAIMACIAANLGAGLDFNEVTRQLELRISTDTGNVAQIGSDGGFYSPAGAPPGPMTWPKTVATLPAQPLTASGGSGLVIPTTSPLAIEHTIANNIDIYATSVYTLADGVAFEHLDDRDDVINPYVDNPSAITWRNLGSTNLPSLRYDAGTRLSPTARSAPNQFTEPDGGWAGFYSAPFTPRTVAELLRIIRGRAVVTMFVRFEGLTPADNDQAIASVASVVQAVVDAGAQDWVIIMPQDNYDDSTRTPINDMMALITGAGITGGVNIFTEQDNVDPWTPAEILATGATWVDIASPSHPSGADAARISEFVNAGLEVMVFTDARQYWTDWAFDLGARTVRCRDAVYGRGGRGQPGDLAYRQNFIPGLETRTAVNGGMTPLNAFATAVFDQGFARLDEPGRWFPPRYAWVSGSALYANNQLLGTICPIPDTTNFELRLRIRREGATSTFPSRFGGIFWGFADDRDIANAPSQPNNPNRNGYGCIIREPLSASVHQGIYRQDAGVEVALATTTTGPGWQSNIWVDLTVTVAADLITFHVNAGGSEATVSVSDATYRGPYVFYGWTDPGSGSATQVHGYDNGPGMVIYEAQS